jgi:hypothetical protein
VFNHHLIQPILGRLLLKHCNQCSMIPLHWSIHKAFLEAAMRCVMTSSHKSLSCELSLFEWSNQSALVVKQGSFLDFEHKNYCWNSLHVTHIAVAMEMAACRQAINTWTCSLSPSLPKQINSLHDGMCTHRYMPCTQRLLCFSQGIEILTHAK